MTQVAVVIDRHPADIHGDLVGLLRLKFGFAASKAVVDAQGHAGQMGQFELL